MISIHRMTEIRKLGHQEIIKIIWTYTFKDRLVEIETTEIWEILQHFNPDSNYYSNLEYWFLKSQNRFINVKKLLKKYSNKTETQHFRKTFIYKLVKFQNVSINDPVCKYDTSSSTIKSILNIKTGNLNK